ncbi:PqqD family protein [Prevotella sp.]|uniref:PqqD family protein n=1 Tax=Prevotella sp. TaxID=59823 RepID=UPI003FD86DE6
MKQKKGFNLRNVCGEQIIVAEGKENIDFSNIISMNESSAYLWQKLEGKEFSVEDMAKLLTEEYEVDEASALNDCKELANLWREAEIIEG